MSQLSTTKIALLSTLVGMTAATLTGVINPPLISGTEGALKWQPVLDWDKDTCYQTSAIDSNGNTNPGLWPSNDESECRDASRLWNCNTYVRERCNHGWCVYMYGYYSEMDWSQWSSHKHDWEHAMVWTRGGAPWSVMWSAHGDYSDADPRDVRWEGNHPKLVAHHGTGSTASLRLAKGGDDNVENALGRWQACHLQQIDLMKDSLRRTLLGTDWGSAHMDFTDARFPVILDRIMPSQARADGFTVRG